MGLENDFTLKNFEGPLDLLVYLAQKNEVEIGDIPLQEVTTQYLKRLQGGPGQKLEGGGEFLVGTSSLLLMKSRSLLPGNHACQEEEEEDDPDPGFEMLRHVVDYCRFREAGHRLTHLEETQGGRFQRGIIEEPPKPDRPHGLNFLSLDDLADLLDEVMERAAKRERTIEGEAWSVSDATGVIRSSISGGALLPFTTLFSSDKCRDEMIVAFLALLELMKMQEVAVVEDESTGKIYIMAKEESDDE